MPRKSTIFSHTSSSAETKALGTRIARGLESKRTGAIILLLSGELGSGKTTFTQGFARGLGIKKRITSPTFILIQRHGLHTRHFTPLDSKSYRFKTKGNTLSPLARDSTTRDRNLTGFRNLFHIDCYRIKKAKEFLAIGLREILADPKNIVLIEWPEKIKAILPKGAMKISFAHSKRQNERIINIYS